MSFFFENVIFVVYVAGAYLGRGTLEHAPPPLLGAGPISAGTMDGEASFRLLRR